MMRVVHCLLGMKTLVGVVMGLLLVWSGDEDMKMDRCGIGESGEGDSGLGGLRECKCGFRCFEGESVDQISSK